MNNDSSGGPLVVVMLIAVGVVTARHGAVHAATAGELGCGRNGDSISECSEISSPTGLGLQNKFT